MTNFEKTQHFFMLSLRYAMYGAIFGTVIGICAALACLEKQAIDLFAITLIGTSCGAMCFGAIPLAISGWYLLLVMLGQASSAVRGNEPQKHKVSVKFEE